MEYSIVIGMMIGVVIAVVVYVEKRLLAIKIEMLNRDTEILETISKVFETLKRKQ